LITRISVSDEGVGIPRKDLGKVFERFIQSGETQSKAGGTGLGLPIVKEIIQLHHGNVWAQSPPQGRDKGTAIIIEIPTIQTAVSEPGHENHDSDTTISLDRWKELLIHSEEYIKYFNPTIYNQKAPSELIQDLNTYSAELQAQNAELLDKEKEYMHLTEKFIAVFNASAVGFVVLDSKNIIIDINPGAISMLNGSKVLRPGNRFYPYPERTINEKHIIPKYLNWLDDEDDLPFEMHYQSAPDKWLRFEKESLDDDNKLLTITNITPLNSV